MSVPRQRAGARRRWRRPLWLGRRRLLEAGAPVPWCEARTTGRTIEPEPRVEIAARVRGGALQALERMFELRAA